jgi:hypothetical protein
MSEQTFRSPGFFEQEIELTAPGATPTGVPGGLIGAAASGPAFVPTTVASFSDFEARFGGLDPDRPATYAANEWLKHKGALTFTRVLGAGANANSADVSTTVAQGTVRNSGFKVTGSAVALPSGDNRNTGAVQFLVARHSLPADTTTPSEWRGFPLFSDNPSFSPPSADTLNVVRGVLMFPTGARGMVLDMTGANSSWSGTGALIDDIASTDLSTTSANYKKFKFVISSSQGSAFATTDGYTGLRILTASFNPNDTDYFGKVLNTDPRKFQDEQHLLYLDFPVDDEVAPLDTVGDSCVAIASGSSSTYRQNFGRFDTRYTTARTPSIISQPFGDLEYDLFNFETLTDGASGNDRFKVSISNVRASTDPKNPYGTFDVVVRDLFDTDTSPRALETFTGCDLNPASQNYVAKKIGDRKVTMNFDALTEDERRLQISGKFPNASRRIRVVISAALDSGVVPKTSLPFGFRGVPVARTTQTLTDTASALTLGGRTYGAGAGAGERLACSSSVATGLTGSIIPPLPLRFKVTNGTVDGSAFTGQPGILEIPDSRLHWGVKFERLIPSGTTSGKIENSVMNSNAGTEFDNVVLAYSRFQGIQKLDALVTGSDADVFNANKFTLARVALSNTSISDVTGTVESHMKETAYIRNGAPNSLDYRITDSSINRLTFASLLSGSASTFNKFSEYAKFSTIFYGGFDGLNVLDGAAAKLGDRSTSIETGGLAASAAAGLARSGLGYDPNGDALSNNAVNSYRTAAKLMTDKLTVNTNVLAIPGIREPLITDYVARRMPAYALGMYVIDVPSYNDSNVRIFEDSTGVRPNVTKTADALSARALNNNYTAAYFPDVFVNDQVSGRRVKVPASVAALGALAYGDKVSYPWYAPAGFNRAALDFVSNVEVRLSTSDRDYLYENLINPIATFPGTGFVIFGQKTLQIAKSAFDRVNVRRLFLELKRVIAQVARGLIFEPNDATTRKAFVDRASPLLSLIKSQAGVEQFRIICDETNNTQADIEASRLNGRIIVVPTRAVEFIAVDFIITPAGVEFV